VVVHLNELVKESGKCLICWFIGGLLYTLIITKTNFNGTLDLFQALVDGLIISFLLIMLYIIVMLVIYNFYKPTQE